jgi:sarcosine oxidase, subunit delta
MLRINCPWCGKRDEMEFTFGGPAHIARPRGEVADAQWTDYLFVRENPQGLHYERWCHTYGCAQWFNMMRDTNTHEIRAIYRMGDAKPTAGQS